MSIVATQNGHKDQFMFKPFSSPSWAKHEGNFPVVDIETPAGLSGLAQFLSENISATHRRRKSIVTCYAAEGTERELIRKQHGARMGSNGQLYSENLIKCYGVSETERAVINDWDFGLLRHGQSAIDFWNEQAAIMVDAGVEIVKVRSSVSAVSVEFDVRHSK